MTDADKLSHVELAAYRAAFNQLEQSLNFWTDTQYHNGRTGMDFRDFKRVLHYRFEEARKIIGVAFEQPDNGGPIRSCDTCKFSDPGGWVCHQKENATAGFCGDSEKYDKWEPSSSDIGEKP